MNTMIKNMGKLLALSGMLMLASPAWALTLQDGTNVGDFDVDLNLDFLVDASIATETAWAEASLGLDLDFTTRIDTLIWQEIFDGGSLYGNAWTQDLIQPADYFVVYVNTENSQLTYDHVLYENAADLTYAIIDANPVNVGGIGLGDINRVVHISMFNEAANPVPEPTTLALLSIGLLGAGFARRRKQK